MTRHAVAVLCFFLLVNWGGAVNLRAQKKEKLESILKDYDVRFRPDGVNATGEHDPVVVTVNMFVRSISKIDDTNMECSVQVTLRQMWTDSRLQYDDMGGSIKYLTLTEPYRVWIPDLFFSNEKQGQFHNIVTPNLYIRIYPSGQVLYSIRLSLVLSCPMNLVQYPFDRQIFSMRLASYGFTSDDVIFKWKEGEPVQVVKNLHLPKFDLKQYHTDTCNSRTNTGEYSCLKLDMLLERNFFYYLINVFIPSTMLVIVSWFAFWFDHSAVSTRVAIGLTTLMVMVFQTMFLKTHGSPVSYRTSLDCWTGICLTFLFAALLESTVVNYLSRCGGNKSAARKDQALEDGENLDMKPLMERHQQEETSGAPTTARNGEADKLTCKQRAELVKNLWTKIPTCSARLDVVARIAFPLGFAVFVFGYWLSVRDRE